MQIAKHKVVTFEYTLTDDGGAVIDSSKGREPFAYIQGTGNIIPGLEDALEGKSAGEQVQARIPPERAYGERDNRLSQVVPKDRCEGAETLEVGMQFHTQGEAGHQVVTITSVEDNEVTVDANHPLAGMHLNFDVTVLEVRDATEEELAHGHVHGPGGHEH